MALDVTEKVADKNNLVTEVAKLKSIIESTSDAIFLSIGIIVSPALIQCILW